jgi:JmjC domain, hydroxylase
MCLLEEQTPMSATQFKKLATSTSARPPKRGHSGDDMLERAFWSSVTFNPPLYGADTPISMFDNTVPWGWNLRHIHCLLKDYKVPKITGVTSPMTYFGTWRSFFGWHKEDCDLMSVNYLHFGAPKIWYSVSPKHAAKFDRMAEQLFPDAAKACPAFVRHKDVVISPKILKQYGVPFVQAKQKPGEFIVLNAAAYHTGFNLGFNCAEAVNFALPQWMEVGRDCVQCECGALPDGVQLDMSLFFPGFYDSSDSESDEGNYSSSSDEEEVEESSSDEEEIVVRSPGRRAGLRQTIKRPASRVCPIDRKEKEVNKEKKKRCRESSSTPQPQSTHSNNKRPKVSSEKKSLSTNLSSTSIRTPAIAARSPRVPDLPTLKNAIKLPPGAAHVNWGPVADTNPMALVTKDPETRELRFELVHRLDKKGGKVGGVWIGALKEEADGLYRPSSGGRQEQLGWNYPKLVTVRTEWSPANGKKRGGWKLTTLPKRIFM